MQNEEKAITVADFCAKYQIHRASYYRNVKLGRMPASIKVGGATRILVSEEQDWLARQRYAPLARRG